MLEYKFEYVFLVAYLKIISRIVILNFPTTTDPKYNHNIFNILQSPSLFDFMYWVLLVSFPFLYL